LFYLKILLNYIDISELAIEDKHLINIE
jgi:hypothetical protein